MKGIALGLCQWKDGYLWHEGKIWVPNNKEIRLDLIRRHHNILQAGHGGTAKTTELLQRTYYWPHRRDMIKQYVKNCDTCERTKVVRHSPYGQMKPNEAQNRLWKSISMDLITDLPKSEGDMQSVLSSIDSQKWLICCDGLKKWTHGDSWNYLWGKYFEYTDFPKTS